MAWKQNAPAWQQVEFGEAWDPQSVSMAGTWDSALNKPAIYQQPGYVKSAETIPERAYPGLNRSQDILEPKDMAQLKQQHTTWLQSQSKIDQFLYKDVQSPGSYGTR